jgi:predicted signal transduction protein with EAL and GGDEF domain
VTFHAAATTGQGYLFGRPMPCDEMVQLLSASIPAWPDRLESTALQLSHVEAVPATVI